MEKQVQENISHVSTEGNDSITRDEVVQIALDVSGVTEEDISLLRIEQDYEDGTQTYEVNFYVGVVEYNYTIDVNTGEILGFEMD